jgi:Cu/Ag efflux protein CusF
MHAAIVSLLAVALLLCASAGFASDATGAIKSINGQKRVVTLKNDDTYVVGPNVDLSKLKIGQRVKITFSGKNEASAVDPAP